MSDTNPKPIQREAHELPSALGPDSKLLEQLKGKVPAVFLDYDGCLSPIVQNPEDAVLSKEMRQTLKDLADLCPVAVVSGRDRQNVYDLVKLDNVYFAGSHGFDITGPGNMQNEPATAKEIVPELDAAEEKLNEKLQHVQGVLIERKKFAIAVHYRNVADAQVDELLEEVDNIIAQHQKLKKGPGKKIMELKPNMDWHKGKAVEWLLQELNLNRPEVVPIFVGDDLTDEDAFAALQGHGITILVGEHDEKTFAEYRLEDVAEVRQFLEMLKKRTSRS